MISKKNKRKLAEEKCKPAKVDVENVKDNDKDQRKDEDYESDNEVKKITRAFINK
jgi:hypothetical protein